MHAFRHLGTLLSVPKGARLQCIGQEDLRDGAVRIAAEGDVAHVHIHAEQAGCLVFVEIAAAECQVEAVVEDGASLTVICMQGAATSGIVRQRSQVGRGAQVRWQNVSLAADMQCELESHLVGAEATSDIDCIFYIHGDERCRMDIRNVFAARGGGGEIRMRGVAEQRAHGTCRGLIEIAEEGGGTDTYLTQEVLMLDPAAKVDAVPGLEIRTNDVKASHSATVSRVTEEDLFYFAARGILPAEARKMFVLGFVQHLTDSIAHEEAKETTLQALEQKYQNMVQ